MRTFGVVPLNPLSNGGASLGEVAKVIQPDALLFEAAEEAFDEAVLRRRIRRDEFLTQLIVAAGGANAPTLKISRYRCAAPVWNLQDATWRSAPGRPPRGPSSASLARPQRKFVAGHFDHTLLVCSASIVRRPLRVGSGWVRSRQFG
jgi:hypothetical protein